VSVIFFAMGIQSPTCRCWYSGGMRSALANRRCPAGHHRCKIRRADPAASPGRSVRSVIAAADLNGTVTASPDRLDLVVAAFLPKILISAFFVRDRPGRASPRKSQKASDSRGQPGEPSVTNVTRRIEFHLLDSWQVT